jgi:hypothetical protein
VTCPPIVGPGREFACSTMDVLKGAQMARRKNCTPEEIVTKLRQVEVATAKGQAVALACKELGSPSRPTIGAARVRRVGR